MHRSRVVQMDNLERCTDGQLAKETMFSKPVYRCTSGAMYKVKMGCTILRRGVYIA